MARTTTAQTAPPPTDTTTPPITAAPTDVGIVWTCPYCGGTDPRVLYDERRACRVAKINDTGDPADVAPWPSYTGDELVDIDPGSFTFHCESCLACEITPRKGKQTDAMGY